MGQTIEHKCNSCDFEFLKDDTEFYFNKDLTKLEENQPLFLSFKEIAMSPLSGMIYISYCDECDKFIKTYSIHKNETSLSDSEIEELILANERYDEIAGKEVEKLVLKRAEEEKFINCPLCGRPIELSLGDGSKCPQCENGKLLVRGFKLVD